MKPRESICCPPIPKQPTTACMQVSPFLFNRRLDAELAYLTGQVRLELSRLSAKDKVPDLLIRAILIAEDRRFYRHRGVDVRGIGRAIWQFVKSRQLSGASTIEQQLVRTLRNRYDLTLRRKLTEMMLAVAISERFEKRDLVEVYANVA